MKQTTALSLRALVKTYYRQNAILFVFLFYMMFLAVGTANGVGMVEYHFSLIRGMLTTQGFLLVVLAAWLLYALKCIQFFDSTLRKPEYSFLYLLAQRSRRENFLLMLTIQLWLYMPVLLYLIAVIIVGLRHAWYGYTAIVCLVNLAILFASAFYYTWLIRQPGQRILGFRWRMPFPGRNSYASFLLRYILSERKTLFLVTKIYSCLMLQYAIGNGLEDGRVQAMSVLFYSTAMLGHGMLIFLLGKMEDERLSFYRGLPVTLGRRLGGYAIFYLLLLTPEILLTASRVPRFLSWNAGILLILFSYGLLLLLNSLHWLGIRKRKSFLKIVVILFFVVFLGLVSGTMIWLTSMLFIFSALFFFNRYYRYTG